MFKFVDIEREKLPQDEPDPKFTVDLVVKEFYEMIEELRLTKRIVRATNGLYMFSLEVFFNYLKRSYLLTREELMVILQQAEKKRLVKYFSSINTLGLY